MSLSLSLFQSSPLPDLSLFHSTSVRPLSLSLFLSPPFSHPQSSSCSLSQELFPLLSLSLFLFLNLSPSQILFFYFDFSQNLFLIHLLFSLSFSISLSISTPFFISPPLSPHLHLLSPSSYLILFDTCSLLI